MDARIWSYGPPLSGRSPFRDQSGRRAGQYHHALYRLQPSLLDHTFGGKISSCLVNPRACYETELPMTKTDAAKRVAVIGAGPAGLATMTAAQVGLTSPCSIRRIRLGIIEHGQTGARQGRVLGPGRLV